MLFGNGLSALLTLMGISAALVAAVRHRTAAAGRRRGRADALARVAGLFRRARRRLHADRGRGAAAVRAAARPPGLFADGHAVLAAARHRASAPRWSRRFDDATLRTTGVDRARRRRRRLASASSCVVTPVVAWAIPLSRAARIAVAVAMLVPMGVALGMPMPAGIRAAGARAPEMVTWAWGINGALSVLGATLAIFIAMNWGFQVTLLSASGVYLVGIAAFCASATSALTLQLTRPGSPTRTNRRSAASNNVGQMNSV